MEEDAVLDYFELQISGNTCELIAAANGQREMLGSGHLKRFLAHLRPAREQYTGDSEALIRLGSVEEFGQHDWFNKRTLKRFAYFVSCPEVLEWANSIHDEIAQLEELRSTHSQQGATARQSLTGPRNSDLYEKINDDLQSPLHVIDDEAESSKKELLKALDMCLVALQHQQATALNHATSAGFEHSDIQDLIAFSEHFGAERLCAACNCFLRCCARGQITCMGYMDRAEMSLVGVDQKDAFIGIHDQDAQGELHHVHQRRWEVLESGSSDSGEGQPSISTAPNMHINRLHADLVMGLFGESSEQQTKSHEYMESDISSTSESASSSRSKIESEALSEPEYLKGYGSMNDPLSSSFCEIVSLSGESELVNSEVDEYHSAVEHTCGSTDEGRFYGRYMKLRDAKLLEEDHLKKAEREAKLKHLEESLEIAKVHMKSLSSRRNRLSQVTAQQHAASKLDANEGQEPAGSARRMESILGASSAKDSKILSGSLPSYVLSPSASNGKEAFEGLLNLQHSSSLPLSSMPMLKRTLVIRPGQQNSSCDSSFGDLRKENTKPSCRKYSRGLHIAESNVCKPSPSKSNAAVESKATRSRAAKLDRKHKAALAGESFAFKMPPSANGEKKMIFNASGHSKLRQRTVVPIKDVKPIIQRECSGKQTTGRSATKLKVPSHVKKSDVGCVIPLIAGTLKNSDENALPTSGDHVNVAYPNKGNRSNKQCEDYMNDYDGIFVANSLGKEVEALEFPSSNGTTVLEVLQDDRINDMIQQDWHATTVSKSNLDGSSEHQQAHNTISSISTSTSTSVSADAKSTKISPKHVNGNDHRCPSCGHVRTRSVAFLGPGIHPTPETEASYDDLHRASPVGSSKESSKGSKRFSIFSWKNYAIGPVALDSMNALDQDQRSDRTMVASYKSQKTRANQSVSTSIPAPPTNFKLKDNHTCDRTSMKGSSDQVPSPSLLVADFTLMPSTTTWEAKQVDVPQHVLFNSYANDIL